jgi:glyoxylase-like metal-dependent hydrolase (beta-lactamase superfamily II)
VKVHHLDCATMCPLGGARFGQVDTMVGHCLLVETDRALVLVDTGFGTGDRRRLPWGFRAVARPSLDPDTTALARVRALGFDPRDVRHVVLTHLDLDHAGGISDFPEATVHVRQAELDRALGRPDLRSKLRYVTSQWSTGTRWAPYTSAGERWNGFEAVRSIDGLPADILMIPLGGHSAGHQAVAVPGGPGWLLHVGDLWAHRAHLHGRSPPWGVAAFEWMIADDRPLLRQNQARVRDLARSAPEVRVFCAHDADDLRELSVGH